jgi:sortase A
MKHQTHSHCAYSLLRGGQYLFLVLGILALSYVAYVWFDAQLFQEEQSRQFVQQLKELSEAKKAGVESPAVAVRNGALLGRIEIQAVGLAAMILEGTEDKTLLRAVGHIPGTALPGQKGNVALAGHRDTFFRALRDIGEDDEITLTTSSGSYRYRVESTRVVRPEDTKVLEASGEEILTLVTCYPFELVGPAPRRFIVRARKSPEHAERFP